MNIDFKSIHSSIYFSDGEQDYQRRDIVTIGVRMAGWLEAVELKTGGNLKDLKGSAVLHRGEFEEEDALGRLTYVPEFTDLDIGNSDACFQVDLFLSDSTFEAVLRNVERGRLPTIKVEIQYSIGDENSGIRYGSAPDGSLKIWDNETHEYLPIVGHDILFELVPEPEEPLDFEGDFPKTPSPPTAQQLDKIISEIERLKANTKSIVSALIFVLIIWAIVSVVQGIF